MVIGYIFHMRRTLYANLIGRIAFFTGENIAHIELYLQGLLPKILAIYTIINNYGDYSTLFTEPEANNCFSIIAKLNNRE